MEKEIELLINEAKEVSKNSYSPYSNFKVGASLLTKENRIYKGANIENASYGLSNCAERTCMFYAYSDGVKKEDIIAFCVYSPKKYMVSPCGACRQVMVELLPKNCKVYLAYGSKGEYIISSVDELMPLSFDKEDL
ncbi:MAG: cytidine deaminase [Candidatus Caccosoma sp.]|nr:cytidine deaminase [Candidatus Caccosoma sp.]